MSRRATGAPPGVDVRLLALTVAACTAAPADDAVVDTDDTEVVVREPLGPCPTFADGTDAGAVADSSLDEISGLVASRAHAGTWWVHNDSGDAARVYALDDAGALRATVTLDDAIAADWEDVAASGTGADATLWLGDIGDNFALRAELLVWRLPEPDPAAGDATVPATKLRLAYADGPRDAEALLVDPDTGEIVIVSKEEAGAGVYVGPAEDQGTLQRVADVPFGTDERPGSPLVTAADVTANGRWIVVRTYTHAWVWRRPRGWTLADAFAEAACPAPSRSERQGEAIAWAPDGASYRTVSEDVRPTIWRFDRD